MNAPGRASRTAQIRSSKAPRSYAGVPRTQLRVVPVTPALSRLSSKRLLRLGDKLIASPADPAAVAEFLRVATRRLERDGFLTASVAS